MSAHRFDQLFDKVGETVSIYQSTEGAADEFGNVSLTWALETTETAIVPVPAANPRMFAQLLWAMAGKTIEYDRMAYFRSDSVIANDKRVVLVSGDEYEVSIVDSPTIYGKQVHKVALLRRVLEQK